jgi:hypothetical protein
MITGMAPSRRRSIDHFRTPATRNEPMPQKAKRHCPDCGTVLTWNPDCYCSLCRERLLDSAPQDGRHKLSEAQCEEAYGLRNESKWSHIELGMRYSVTPKHMCRVLSGMKKEREDEAHTTS